MMKFQIKIKKLIETSKKVILDCCLENGAIVAGNSTKPYYPKDAPNCMYVWPRDASFTIVALDILGLDNKVDKFFEWCLERGIDKNGLLWQHYTPNGLPSGFLISELYNEKKIGYLVKKYAHPDSFYPISKAFRSQLQPDGNALLLWALSYHVKNNKKVKQKFKQLAYNLAKGICNIWSLKDQCFKYLYFGPWEEKIGYPGVFLTYDLAISFMGLKIYEDLYGRNKLFLQVRKNIEGLLQNIIKDYGGSIPAIFGPKYSKKNYMKVYSKFFSTGKFNPEIDASLLALIYPSRLLTGSIADQFIENLIRNLDRNGGIIRYPGDSYDGEFILGSSLRKGGNSWPLLNFWLSICLNRIGNHEKALDYYKWVVDKVEQYIPEQIDNKRKHKGPSPLCWSHSMFILASKELGYL